MHQNNDHDGSNRNYDKNENDGYGDVQQDYRSRVNVPLLECCPSVCPPPSLPDLILELGPRFRDFYLLYWLFALIGQVM